MTAILGRHIDGLRVSAKFRFPAHLKAIFDALKDEAKEDAGDLALVRDHISGVPGGPWYIKAKGRANYQYILENSAFYVELSTWASLPSLVVQFKAGTLYEYDPESYEVFVDRLVRYFVGPKLSYSAQVSRFDLAVDFQEDGFSLPDMADVITRARDRTVNYKGDAANTLTLGRRHGSLQAQIYNKSEEILVSDKRWMEQVWSASGNYDARLPVWRCEVRWFRQGLRSLELSTLSEVLASLGDLAYLSVGESAGSWLRVADPGSRGLEAQDRGVASWWSAVQGALKGGLLASGRKRKGYDPSYSFTVAVERAGAYMVRVGSILRVAGYRSGMTSSLVASLVGERYDGLLESKGRCWVDQVNARTAEMRGYVYVPRPVDLLGG